MKNIWSALALCAAMTLPAHAERLTLTIDGSVGKLQAVIQKPDLPEGGRCPMVVLMHGFMGSKDGALETLIADNLEAAGIASVRFDFNGHGQSEGLFENMTVLNEIDDAKAVIGYVEALPYVSLTAVAGHSQGGVVASMTAGQLGREHIAAVVLMAPAAVLRDDAIRGNTMGAFYDPLDPPETVALFGGAKLGRNYIMTAFGLPIYPTAAAYDGPACIIHGTADRVVPYTYGERYHEIWPASELYILDGFDHGFNPDTKLVADMAARYLQQKLH